MTVWGAETVITPVFFFTLAMLKITFNGFLSKI